MSRAFQLPIAAPCWANWSAMPGDARRRYCGQCELHVRDVTHATDAEVLALQQELETKKVCIRRPIEPEELATSRVPGRWIAAGVLALSVAACTGHGPGEVESAVVAVGGDALLTIRPDALPELEAIPTMEHEGVVGGIVGGIQGGVMGGGMVGGSPGVRTQIVLEPRPVPARPVRLRPRPNTARSKAKARRARRKEAVALRREQRKETAALRREERSERRLETELGRQVVRKSRHEARAARRAARHAARDARRLARYQRTTQRRAARQQRRLARRERRIAAREHAQYDV